MTPVTSFIGNHRFLSNFWPASIELDSAIYASVEHAYQASKTLIVSERALIRQAESPGRAKRLGQKVTKRADWDLVKLSIMLELNRHKYKNPRLAKLLMSTGDAHLAEGNTWNDTFWGICKGGGENHLGKILMQIREELNEGKRL